MMNSIWRKRTQFGGLMEGEITKILFLCNLLKVNVNCTLESSFLKCV